ncbi:MAG: MerR family transcriptional regulator [Thauera sp.]|nr:MerR family transcriptional regulator [Thauera sp.]
MAKQAWSIDELAELSGFPARTIRYYQTEGLLAPPVLQGRYATYSQDHLDQLRKIMSTGKRGASRSRTEVDSEQAEPLAEAPSPKNDPRGLHMEPLVRCVIAEGIEVIVSPDRSGLDRKQIRTTLEEIATMLQRRSHDEPIKIAPIEPTSPPRPVVPPLAPASPAGTSKLLDILQGAGLTDEQFRRMHPKYGETIKRHLSYVSGIDVFRAGSQNVLVNHRLQVCLYLLRDQAGQALANVDQSLMDRCVEEAARAIPLVA